MGNVSGVAASAAPVTTNGFQNFIHNIGEGIGMSRKWFNQSAAHQALGYLITIITAVATGALVQWAVTSIAQLIAGREEEHEKSFARVFAEKAISAVIIAGVTALVAYLVGLTLTAAAIASVAAGLVYVIVYPICRLSNEQRLVLINESIKKLQDKINEIDIVKTFVENDATGIYLNATRTLNAAELLNKKNAVEALIIAYNDAKDDYETDNTNNAKKTTMEQAKQDYDNGRAELVKFDTYKSGSEIDATITKLQKQLDHLKNVVKPRFTV